VIPPEELQEPLPTEEQQAQTQDSETVKVKATNVPPDVPVGLGALWWALRHPSQAWKILTPAQ